MELYKKLPSHLQTIVDRKIHEINFYPTLKQIELPVPTCELCNTTEGQIDIYNPGWIEICKTCIKPCHYKMLTLNENALILAFQTEALKPLYKTTVFSRSSFEI